MNLCEGHSINLPVLLETRLLIQANSGGGKSYALRRLLEQTAKGVQQLVIDSEGEFATLREKFDYVIAAPHDADAVATPQTAALLARRLLESGVSAILDIYDLKAHERILFVRRFLEALVNAPRSLWHSCMVVLDEAHVFAPQTGSAESAGAVIDVATRGRKRGLCLVVATQRLSKLHKDVAAEMINKLIGRTGLDVDVKRAADELGMSPRDALAALRDLAPGEFYAFGPALGAPGVEKIAIGSVETTHPKSGQRLMQAPPPASAKLLSSLAKLADLQKEAEQEARTVEELKAENVKLRREATIASKRAEQAGVPEKEVQARIHFAVLESQRSSEILADARAEVAIRKTLERIAEMATKTLKESTGSQAASDRRGQAPTRVAARVVATRPAAASASAADKTGLPAGERATLIACAQHQPNGCTREQLSILTGYKRSTRDAYIQRMREKGFVAIEGAQIVATPAGVAALGDGFEPLPTGAALREHWLARLPRGEAEILRILCEAWPSEMDRSALSERTSFARSSRDAYLQRLSARQLVKTDRGSAKAAPTLFDGAGS